MKYRDTLDFAQRMDLNDPLREMRARFHIPPGQKRAESIYLCGHSLGLQPRLARDWVNQELDAWETLAVRGHFEGPHPWKYYHELLSESSARLVGAHPDEVVIMNSLTVNLHLMLISFYRPRFDRGKILIEAQTFPSDRYAVASQLHLHGLDPQQDLIVVQAEPGTHSVNTEHLLAAIAEHADDLALVLVSGVHYATGQSLDLRALAKATHDAGAVLGVDLAHAVGNIPLRLHEWDVDFAVWCTYKYLNGGPGNLGGCFVHSRHHDFKGPRLEGWWGHDSKTRFQMPDQFQPENSVEAWQLSNPAILPLAALRASLTIFDEVDLDALRSKSRFMTGYAEYLLDQMALPGLSQLTPRDPQQRGCQLSYRVQVAQAPLAAHLEAHDVIVDWREPDILRLVPVPLYNTFQDVFEAVNCLKAGWPV